MKLDAHSKDFSVACGCQGSLDSDLLQFGHFNAIIGVELS